MTAYEITLTVRIEATDLGSAETLLSDVLTNAEDQDGWIGYFDWHAVEGPPEAK